MEPKIRLEGFTGMWEEKPLLDVVTLYNGLTYTPNDITVRGTLVLRSSNVQDGEISLLDNVYVKPEVATSPNVKKGDIIVVVRNGSRALIGKHAHIKTDMPNTVIGAFMTGMHTDEPEFMNALLCTSRFNNEVTINLGATINQITNGTFRSMNFLFPNKKEQQALGAYFQNLDNLIQSTTKKIESLKQVKAASLQSMFPQEGETKPRVRFKGFEGEWEKISLKKFAKRVTRKNKNMESTLALTISSIDGLVSQIDYFNNLVVGANLANYYLLRNGEFAYNKSYSRGYPFGSVKRLDRYEQGILSTLYIVFSINDEISSDYLTHFFDTTLWHKGVAERAEEGARNHGLLNIGADDFMSIDIVVPPSIDEQQKIANYLQNLDSQITLQIQRLEKLKQIKSACLDNMFV